MPSWDAQQYVKFKRERTQPSLDLVSRIEVDIPNTIVDIGCGPGNSTAVLRSRWPGAEISAFDSSPEMLALARKSDSSISWFEADASTWLPERKYDLIFSNAALQWLPNHEQLFPRLLSIVSQTGALAIQMPAYYDSPLHKQLIDVSKNTAWADATAPARSRLSMRPPEFYYDLLGDSASKIDIWQTAYYHEMDSVESILEWFRGTGMRPFLDALQNPEDKSRFESELLDRYRQVYLKRDNGKVLLPFRRFFLIAYK